MRYGYCRSAENKDDSITMQQQMLRNELCDEIISETGSGLDLKNCIKLQQLLEDLKEGDTLVVTSLDRLSRKPTVVHEIILQLFEKGVHLHSLDTGTLEDDFSKRIYLNGFESALMLDRVYRKSTIIDGKRKAMEKGTFKEGRPKKYTQEEMDHAMELLETKSFNQVADETGISRSTLLRESKRRKKANTNN